MNNLDMIAKLEYVLEHINLYYPPTQYEDLDKMDVKAKLRAVIRELKKQEKHKIESDKDKVLFESAKVLEHNERLLKEMM